MEESEDKKIAERFSDSELSRLVDQILILIERWLAFL